jgi:hypothetical protein
MFAVFYGCHDSGSQEPQGLAAVKLALNKSNATKILIMVTKGIGNPET